MDIVTLKASDIVAQGKRIGAAAKRHPGLRFDNTTTNVAFGRPLLRERSVWRHFRGAKGDFVLSRAP